MATLFTRIIAGDIPGRFVWRDETCVAFGTIAPLAPGHMLVVPRSEVDHWIDLDRNVVAHLMAVAQTIGRAQVTAFAPKRVGLIIAGLEVPHTHLHVVPMVSEADLNFANADHAASPESLDVAAESLRVALRAGGYPEVADN